MTVPRNIWSALSSEDVLMIKGYCTSSWINCGMAKSLALARACEGLLTSDLAF